MIHYLMVSAVLFVLFCSVILIHILSALFVYAFRSSYIGINLALVPLFLWWDKFL